MKTSHCPPVSFQVDTLSPGTMVRCGIDCTTSFGVDPHGAKARPPQAHRPIAPAPHRKRDISCSTRLYGATLERLAGVKASAFLHAGRHWRAGKGVQLAVHRGYGLDADDVVGRRLVAGVDDMPLALVRQHRRGRGRAIFPVQSEVGPVQQIQRLLDSSDVLAAGARRDMGRIADRTFIR
jgi:hypothetical protein